MAVGDADRADVIALGEEQLQDQAPVVGEALGIDGHLHAFFDARDARREKARRAFDFDQAEPAGADVRESAQPAERGNGDLVLARDFEDGLVLARAYLAAVDDQGFHADWGFHACASSAGWCCGGAGVSACPARARAPAPPTILQTPDWQRFS